MARKVKIPNEIKKRYSRKPSLRTIDTRSERKYFLIVCEGEETEPNYFISLKENLPKGVLKVAEIRIHGTGFNTASLLTKALEIKKEWQETSGINIDKLWLVMDKDSFKPAIFNATITKCLAKNVDCLWSNEAFELWYPLHFNFFDTAMSRQQYKTQIEQNFRRQGFDEFSYQKNSTEMYQLLQQYGSTTDAIRNAERLANYFAGQTDYANHNP